MHRPPHFQNHIISCTGPCGGAHLTRAQLARAHHLSSHRCPPVLLPQFFSNQPGQALCRNAVFSTSAPLPHAWLVFLAVSVLRCTTCCCTFSPEPARPTPLTCVCVCGHVGPSPACVCGHAGAGLRPQFWTGWEAPFLSLPIYLLRFLEYP